MDRKETKKKLCAVVVVVAILATLVVLFGCVVVITAPQKDGGGENSGDMVEKERAIEKEQRQEQLQQEKQTLEGSFSSGNKYLPVIHYNRIVINKDTTDHSEDTKATVRANVSKLYNYFFVILLLYI